MLGSEGELPRWCWNDRDWLKRRFKRDVKFIFEFRRKGELDNYIARCDDFYLLHSFHVIFNVCNFILLAEVKFSFIYQLDVGRPLN